jgi:broad specificity phosphatase PhoE
VLAPVKLQLKTLFMSRHGESQFNEKNKLGGNSSLSAAGDDYATRLCGVYYDTVEKVPALIVASIKCHTTRTV